MYDIIIIGAGVTGCAVARYLSRYEGRMLVLEKAEDVCCGTSKANSAIVHAGFDAAHGSLMAKMNLEGNLMMPQLAKDLDFAFKMNGSLVVCMSEEDLPKLHALYENGVKNGVEQLELIDAERLHELEPHVSQNAVAALWAPTAPHRTPVCRRAVRCSLFSPRVFCSMQHIRFQMECCFAVRPALPFPFPRSAPSAGTG